MAINIKLCQFTAQLYLFQCDQSVSYNCPLTDLISDSLYIYTLVMTHNYLQLHTFGFLCMIPLSKEDGCVVNHLVWRHEGHLLGKAVETAVGLLITLAVQQIVLGLSLVTVKVVSRSTVDVISIV